jgi:PhnB protein
MMRVDAHTSRSVGLPQFPILKSDLHMQTTQLIPTIYFQGICRDAVSYYRDAIGAEVLFQLSVTDVVGADRAIPGTENKILRAALRLGEATIYLSDGHREGPLAFQGFCLSVRLPNRQELERVHQSLAMGGTVQVPVRQAAWADAYGAVIDKFGVHWALEAGVQGQMANAA